MAYNQQLSLSSGPNKRKIDSKEDNVPQLHSSDTEDSEDDDDEDDNGMEARPVINCPSTWLLPKNF